MKLIDETALDEYLAWANKHLRPTDINAAEAMKIGHAIDRIGLLDALLEGIMEKILSDFKKGVAPESTCEVLFSSAWVMGFQMGREFETRELDKALKHTIRTEE